MILRGWGARKSGFGERKRVSDWGGGGEGKGVEKEKTVPLRGRFSMSLADLENTPVGYFPVTLRILKYSCGMFFRKAVVGSANQARKFMQ